MRSAHQQCGTRIKRFQRRHDGDAGELTRATVYHKVRSLVYGIFRWVSAHFGEQLCAETELTHGGVPVTAALRRADGFVKEIGRDGQSFSPAGGFLAELIPCADRKCLCLWNLLVTHPQRRARSLETNMLA